MLKTKVTARALTSAKPCSCPSICRSRVMSDPRAVSQVDGVAEVVRADRRAALQADREVDSQRGETAAAGRVRERRECVRGDQVVGNLGAGGAARGAGLPVERVATRVAGDGDGAPGDVAASAACDLERGRAGRVRSHVTRAVDVAANLVQRQTGRELRLEATILLRRRLRPGYEDVGDAC